MSDRQFTLPRGIRDIEPDEMAKRNWVYERIREMFRRYAFQEMEPATLEELRTLEAKSGPAIKDEIYWFNDKAGRSIGLRFDLTVGMARMVAGRSDLPEPIKLACIGGNWRYDEPQFGRYRYFTQWDAEIFGSDDPTADAEAVALSMDILSNVGLKEFEVRISNRKVIQGFVESLGLKSQEKIEAVFRTVDKSRKISAEAVKTELLSAGLESNVTDSLIEFISIQDKPASVLEKISEVQTRSEEAKLGYRQLVLLADALQGLGKLDRCLFDMSVVRGIGYYDGIVFEAFDKGGEEVGAVLGGGRYDRLCGVYGKRSIPATGVAGGIERLLISLEKAGVLPKHKEVGTVFVAAVNDEVRQHTLSIAATLRDARIPSDVDVKRKSLARQLEYANSLGIPYALIVGPQELKSGQFKLRDMKKRTEETLTLDEIITRINRMPSE
ncbi:MAG: histidine--tRNA ligase [Candidatus Bathyarchaeia archaeon]